MSVNRPQVATSMLFFLLCISGLPALMAESRNYPELRDFKGLEVSSGIQVKASRSNAWSVAIKADPADLADLLVERRGEVLYLGFKPGVWPRRHGLVEATVSFPRLDSLSLSGGSRADIGFDQPSQGLVDIRLSGGSVCTGTLVTGQLQCDLSGGSRLELAGKTGKLTCQLSGGSALPGRDFRIDSANIDLSGGSRAELTVSQNLVCAASGGSRLVYRGQPTVQKTLSGGSAVEAAGN